MVPGKVPLLYGTCNGIRAVWKSGGWGCCGSNCGNLDNSWVWQRCKCYGRSAGNGPNSCTGKENFAFELMKNNKYIVEMPSYNTLPPECTAPSTRTGDISCKIEFSLERNDKLAVTWYEPSHDSSASDNTGPIKVDVYCNMEGILIIKLLKSFYYTIY